jgi:hypothetical protein
MFKQKPLVVALAAAAALVSTTASAAIPAVSGVADAMLNVLDFQVRTDTGATIGIGTPVNGAALTSASTTHQATTELNEVGGLNFKNINGGGLVLDNNQSEIVPIGTNITYFSTIGNIGVWAPTTPYTATTIPPLTEFSRAQTDSTGNAITGSDDVVVHSTSVVLGPLQSAAAGAQQNLSSQFTINVTDPLTLVLSFTGEGFLRAALGQDASFGDPNTAIASFSWSATLSGNGVSLAWNPDGTAGNLICSGPVGFSCSETLDAFDMSQTLNTTFEDDQSIGLLMGAFEVRVTLPTGVYNFGIGHTTQTTVLTPTAVVPVPGTLALLGLGLLGLGARVRKYGQQ